MKNQATKRKMCIRYPSVLRNNGSGPKVFLFFYNSNGGISAAFVLSLEVT